MATEPPQLRVDGEHVQIEVVDERTARLAAEYVQAIHQDYQPTASAVLAAETEGPNHEFEPNEPVPPFDEQELGPTPTDSADTEATDETSGLDETDAVDSAEEPGDTDDDDTDPDPSDEAELPVDGRPWEQYDDRDARVEAFIDAMYAHYGEPFEIQVKEIVPHVDATGEGVYYGLRALEEYAATKVGEDEGRTIWRITQADAAGEESSEPDTADVALEEEIITVEGRSQQRQLSAAEVVAAIANAPGSNRAKAPLGLDDVGFENLLLKLDLAAKFEADAPLSKPLVEETVATYLQERDA
jgi:hypothetical protein